MACPGGCIGGAGQPVSRDRDIRSLRTKGLYDVDKNLDLHKSQENHFVTECYQRHSGRNRRAQSASICCTRITRTAAASPVKTIQLGDGPAAGKVKVNVCAGTNCFLKDRKTILHELLHHVETEDLAGPGGNQRLVLFREMRPRPDRKHGRPQNPMVYRRRLPQSRACRQKLK